MKNYKLYKDFIGKKITNLRVTYDFCQNSNLKHE